MIERYRQIDRLGMYFLLSTVMGRPLLSPLLSPLSSPFSPISSLLVPPLLSLLPLPSSLLPPPPSLLPHLSTLLSPLYIVSLVLSPILSSLLSPPSSVHSGRAASRYVHMVGVQLPSLRSSLFISPLMSPLSRRRSAGWSRGSLGGNGAARSRAISTLRSGNGTAGSIGGIKPI